MFSMQHVFFHLLYYTLATLNTKHEMCSRINRLTDYSTLDKVTKTKADGAIRTQSRSQLDLFSVCKLLDFIKLTNFCVLYGSDLCAHFE